LQEDTKIRRTNIIYCDDVQCKFKQVNRGLTKLAGECALELGDAVRFLGKYKLTTCEVGTGECKVCDDYMENEMVIRKLKYKGRI
jgi:hypothetical protein